MPNALYYPHSEIRSETVLKNALLLWDSVETIVPRHLAPSGRGRPRAIVRSTKPTAAQEAVDLIVRPRQPSNVERIAAHKQLSDLVRSGQVAMLLANSPRNWQNERYLIYPDKFLGTTWHMLEQQGLARFEYQASDYGVPPALGYLMMSLLADTCAGTQIRKITDRVDAYRWLAHAHASTLGTAPVVGFDVSQVAPSHDRLVSISLEVLDARNIPLRTLVDFRKREAKSGDEGYAQMRKRYLATLDAHIEKVAREAKSATDVRELENAFKKDIRYDVQELKKDLKTASKNALFSKEVALTTVAVAGALINPIAGLTALAHGIGAAGVIPLLGAANKLKGERRQALNKHVSSWVYLSTKRRLQVH